MINEFFFSAMLHKRKKFILINCDKLYEISSITKISVRSFTLFALWNLSAWQAEKCFLTRSQQIVNFNAFSRRFIHRE